MNTKLRSLLTAIGVVCVFLMSIAFIGITVTLVANTIIFAGKKLESIQSDITHVQRESFCLLIGGSVAFCACAVFMDYFDKKSDRQPITQLSTASNIKSKSLYSHCQNCQNFHGQAYGGNTLVCAIHPYGWQDENCPDFTIS
ncbi:hypothetical protein G7B40_031055 [Aetokthonos hydrillicola Thurmond2011]|jgi:uncharacterized membrane protein|uniref:Uncharacterized protein n=1 Tax=Aetokthonos hydrillicola Thurmond2011 TaxID=2712845 RepID=A0AAP5ID07_9CYAN|nr:hypothetical protein [Aetokthonos hydrillicola]MBO3462116.1 hypothetical protein [Aetokthonos hydrillicola CCALA 1050]MBW4589710.1 hypothetical protein [Aetokthonos hydrillicola CCALA 1050]MDR9898964.1 hypothetical protein [Aetokthonos hydrillicola Thurmond2011]